MVHHFSRPIHILLRSLVLVALLLAPGLTVAAKGGSDVPQDCQFDGAAGTLRGEGAPYDSSTIECVTDIPDQDAPATIALTNVSLDRGWVYLSTPPGRELRPIVILRFALMTSGLQPGSPVTISGSGFYDGGSRVFGYVNVDGSVTPILSGFPCAGSVWLSGTAISGETITFQLPVNCGHWTDSIATS